MVPFYKLHKPKALHSGMMKVSNDLLMRAATTLFELECLKVYKSGKSGVGKVSALAPAKDTYVSCAPRGSVVSWLHPAFQEFADLKPAVPADALVHGP